MNEDQPITIRPLDTGDVPAACQILTSTRLVRTRGAGATCRALYADGPNRSRWSPSSAGEVVGVILAVYNGFHVFLSHLAVIPGLQRQGVARRLHDELTEAARRLGAMGVITDSRLTTTGFFYQLGYRTPGSVFLLPFELSKPRRQQIERQRLCRRLLTAAA